MDQPPVSKWCPVSFKHSIGMSYWCYHSQTDERVGRQSKLYINLKHVFELFQFHLSVELVPGQCIHICVYL